MLNVKNALTKILGVFDKWMPLFAKPLGDAETETFPFTATKSGVCCVVVVPPTSAVSYLYVTENGGVHARGYTTGGITYTLSFPVVKGNTYALSNSANYSITNGVRIYPIIGGGVLLKGILTPCRKAVGVC